MNYSFSKIKRVHISYNSGFTLIETVVTIFTFGVIMVGITLMLKNIFLTNSTQSLVINTVDRSQRVANTFINELRNASNGLGGAYPIGEASNTQLVFFSTAPQGNGTISRVRYYISGNTLYKGITNPTGSPGTYNLANETVTTLLTGMSLGSDPLFYYHDGDYAGTGSALTQPVNINSIKFIKINLVVLKQSSYGSTATFTVNTGAAIRNLKTNLGN
jgi:type II secretory pathway component PulJ